MRQASSLFWGHSDVFLQWIWKPFWCYFDALRRIFWWFTPMHFRGFWLTLMYDDGCWWVFDDSWCMFDVGFFFHFVVFLIYFCVFTDMESTKKCVFCSTFFEQQALYRRRDLSSCLEGTIFGPQKPAATASWDHWIVPADGRPENRSRIVQKWLRSDTKKYPKTVHQNDSKVTAEVTSKWRRMSWISVARCILFHFERAVAKICCETRDTMPNTWKGINSGKARALLSFI